jgi:hypothetical protein
MANRRYDRDWTLGERIIRLYGSFGTNGAAAPVASSVKGFGFGYAPTAGVMALQGNVGSKAFLTSTPGITYTATGILTITFEDPYIDCIAFIPTIQLPSAGTTDVIGGTMVNLGSSTAAPSIQILTVNSTSGAAVAPPASAANTRINFVAVFRDSTVQFTKP